LLCCGSGIFIPDPGSEFFHPVPGSLLDPGSKRFPDPESGFASASKNLSIFTQKIVSKISEKLSGMFVPDPDLDFFYPSQIPDPGVKKAPDPGSGSATLVFCHA
jgi:hypothetical protein